MSEDMGYIVFSPLRPLLTQPRSNLSRLHPWQREDRCVTFRCGAARSQALVCGQTGASRLSLPGLFAVSWQGRAKETGTPQACVASARLVSKLRAAVSGDALAPDGSASSTIRANCPALPRNLGGAVGSLLCTIGVGLCLTRYSSSQSRAREYATVKT